MPSSSPTLIVPSFVDQFLQYAGVTTNIQAALDRDTDIKLKEIDTIFKIKKDDVVESLLARATLVLPELHRNLKKVTLDSQHADSDVYTVA